MTGTEWDNEITLATSKHSFIKGQFCFFFPGDTVEDVTSALTSFRNPATERPPPRVMKWPCALAWNLSGCSNLLDNNLVL
ncbi:MAG: hypothetical protein R2874_08635 [Desulfobacterales bacterium]